MMGKKTSFLFAASLKDHLASYEHLSAKNSKGLNNSSFQVHMS